MYLRVGSLNSAEFVNDAGSPQILCIGSKCLCHYKVYAIGALALLPCDDELGA